MPDNPVALSTVVSRDGREYPALLIWCPGCATFGGGLHMLPVNTTSASPQWDWDGDIDAPSLSPSILSRFTYGEERREVVCHSFLRAGVWEFLSDSTHEFTGQHVPMVPLPDWVVDKS